MTHHDFRPAFRRLSAVMGWDDLPAGPPPNEWLKALARATRGAA